MIADIAYDTLRIITPVFIVLVLWRLTRLEKRVEWLTQLFINHIQEKKK